MKKPIFCCDNVPPTAHPSYPRMGNTISISHPCLFHDAPYLTHSDNKIVHVISSVQTCGTSLIVPNGEYRSMPHPPLFHDAHLLPHFDDKIVQRAIAVQICATSLIVPNGEYRSMPHPLLFHDAHLLPHFDNRRQPTLLVRAEAACRLCRTARRKNTEGVLNREQRLLADYAEVRRRKGRLCRANKMVHRIVAVQLAIYPL